VLKRARSARSPRLFLADAVVITAPINYSPKHGRYWAAGAQARVLRRKAGADQESRESQSGRDTTPEIARELKISDSKVRCLLAGSEGLLTSYLSETAQVARLLDLDRLDGALSVAFPVAVGRESATNKQPVCRDETSLRERWEAMRIVLDVIKERSR
jgi:hypothetical protein